jgi:hypothetical protein
MAPAWPIAKIAVRRHVADISARNDCDRRGSETLRLSRSPSCFGRQQLPHCRPCQRERPIATPASITMHWRDRLVCSRCGSRDIDMVLTGERR